MGSCRRRPVASAWFRVFVVPVVFVSVPLVSLSEPLSAQATIRGEAAALGVNALLGGLTSGVGGWMRGGSFLESFGAGVLGGSIAFAGKRIAASQATGAGLAGRFVGSVGASMVLNGSRAEGLFETIVLPVGPLNVYRIGGAGEARWTARLNVGRTIYLGRMLLRSDRELLWGETLSAGAPVFVARDTVLIGESGDGIGGFEVLGTISITDPNRMGELDPAQVLAHERVHILQDDFVNITWAGPLEGWLLGLVGGEEITRYVDLGVAYIGLVGPMVFFLPYDRRPWEVEAGYMDGGW